VVEVSSEGTEAIDRREKLLVYHGIASWIVARDRREVTVHFRAWAGVWQTRGAMGRDGIEAELVLPETANLDAIYQDVLSA
jgi:Uma2 family endonuclease